MMNTEKNYELASLGKRWFGQFLDFWIWMAIFVLAGFPLFMMLFLFEMVLPQSAVVNGIIWILSVCVGMVLFLAYPLLRDGLPNGQSYGKKIVKTQVIEGRNGRPCTLGQSIARNFMGFILSLIPLLWIIDLILIFGEKRQRLGDKIAGTLVVMARENPSREGGIPIRKLLKVYGLVMVGCFVVFIVVAIFAPDNGDETVMTPSVDSEQTVERLVELEATEPKVKRMKWNLTLEDQGIKVGNWITVQGYSGAMFGSWVPDSWIIGRDGKKYKGEIDYSSGGNATIWLDSRPKKRETDLRFALTDKIAYVQWNSPERWESPVMREYDELCVIIARDLEKPELRHIELSGQIFSIGNTVRTLPDGTKRELKNLIVKSDTGDIRLLTPQHEVALMKRQHERLLSRIKNEKDSIRKQFHFWDGSHIELTKWIKQRMHDPDSYKHVKTLATDNGDHLRVTTTFRGSNLFGGIVTQYAIAKVSLSGEILEADIAE